MRKNIVGVIAVILSAVAGAFVGGTAYATTVATVDVDVSGGELPTTPIVSGSGTGILDSSGVLTVTLNESIQYYHSPTPTSLSVQDTFTGAYASGVFTPTTGTEVGLPCPCGSPTSLGDLTGSMSLSGGGTLSAYAPLEGSAFLSYTVVVTPVPLQPAAWMLGSGLLGLFGAFRRRSHSTRVAMTGDCS